MNLAHIVHLIFLKRLEDKLGFKVELVQTDNGIEFVNDRILQIKRPDLKSI